MACIAGEADIWDMDISVMSKANGATFSTIEFWKFHKLITKCEAPDSVPDLRWESKKWRVGGIARDAEQLLDNC